MKLIRILLLLITTALMSCMKDPKALVVFDDSGDSEVSSLYELPANSKNVTIVEDLSNPKSFLLTVPAQKKHNPDQVQNGFYYFGESVELELPEGIAVTNGRSGNRLLVLSIKRSQSDGLPANLQCAYVGTGSNLESEFSEAAMPYEFDFCIEGSILLTEENVDALRDLPENVFDKSMRSGTFFLFNRTDKISLQVKNGNSTLSDTTDVELKINFFKL